MSEIFHAPEGYLDSNIGLLAGTVIQELRMHPYIDRELEGCQWNYEPEYLKFTVLSVEKGGYVCQYSGEKNTFSWSAWKEQPHYGFMDDGSTPICYYIESDPVPPPYESKSTRFCPYTIRCTEIDQAALLVKDPNTFAALVAEPEVSHRDLGVCLEWPSKRFLAEGGCPFYQCKLNYGSGANVLCAAVREQLHGYVELKFCEGGRKVYCPIWQAESRKLNVSKSDTEEG